MGAGHKSGDDTVSGNSGGPTDSSNAVVGITHLCECVHNGDASASRNHAPICSPTQRVVVRDSCGASQVSQTRFRR